jgi:antirestriction protein ArdC
MKDKQTVYEMVTDRIVEFIEKNEQLPWTKPWATVESEQQNFMSKKPYSGINALLTGISGFTSPYWLTLKQANELGGRVKKGAKSTPIIYWQPARTAKKSKKEKAEEDDENNQEYKLQHGFHRPYSVFNAEQIEGIEFPDVELPTYDFNPIEEAERVIEAMPNRPFIQTEGNGAFYSPFLDKVTVPSPQTFTCNEEFYSALFHELTHSTGHPSRLDRFKADGCDHLFGSRTYSKEELVAEMGSAFILNSLRINTEHSDRNSAAYVKSWLKALKNDPKMVITAASKAGKAANYIMNLEVQNV